MSKPVAIVGPSGSGKSTAIEGLNPETTAIINVLGKDLPFRGWRNKYSEKRKNYAQARKSGQIVQYLKAISENRPNVTDVVIDDAHYIMATEFIDRALEKGYDKWSEMAKHLYSVVNPDLHSSLRDDLYVYLLFHTEDNDGKEQIKTSGKLIKQHLTMEGLFTVVLFTEVEPPESGEELANYTFRTNTNGKNTAKSPKGMFPLHIPNDLGVVRERMDAYFHGEELEEIPDAKQAFAKDEEEDN